MDAAYEGYRKCVYLSSVNLDPQRLNRMREYFRIRGWDFDTVHSKWFTQQNAERALQVLSRTVIRNRANLEKVSYLVIDKATAEYLKENYFYNCEIKHTGIKLPEKVRKQKETTKGDLQYERVKAMKAEGKKNREIAESIGLSLKQVEKYSARINKEAA